MDLITSMLFIFVILILYYLAVELFTILLRMTGLNKPISRFQVISMIIGVGFTTAESELIVEDNRRRRIAVFAILTGALLNTVIIGLLINMMNSLITTRDKSTYMWLILIVISFLLIILILQIPFIKRTSERVVNFVATKLFRMNSKENVITLLDRFGSDVIAEVLVNDIPNILHNKTVYESGIKTKYNLNILMIKRNKANINVRPETMLAKEDTILIFGRKNIIEEIFKYHVNSNPTYDDNKNTIRLLDNYGKDAMVRVKLVNVPKILEGVTLESAGLRSNFDLSVLNIIRNDESIRPKKDSTFLKLDELVVYGPLKSIESVFLIEEEI